jgi:hypothetical protein
VSVDRLVFAACCSLLVASAATLAPLASAGAADDVSPPVLTTPVKASFRVGDQLETGRPQDCGDDPHDIRVHQVPMTFSWSGSDDSGPVSYSLEQETGRDGPSEVLVDSPATSYEGLVGSNGDQNCGGGNPSVHAWHLTASDPSGGSTTNDVYGGRIRLTQDSGASDLAGYATLPTLAYTGSWAESRCVCWSDGTAHRSTAAGASVTIVPTRFTVFPSNATNHHVALVMAKGADRGRFAIYVDDQLRTTVDLYAATSRSRNVVWQTAFRDFGHNIRLVNLATPGRPRIDLDAVLTN